MHAVVHMKTRFACVMAVLAVLQASCGKKTSVSVPPPLPRDGSATFAQDVEFLKQHTDVHVPEDVSSGARVAVAPAWQGRVMTSTSDGANGGSMGWIHYANVETGILPEEKRTGLAKHIHVFGGEERFWLGPEGGQFALFFPPAPAAYEFANWKTPALMDTEAFEVVRKDATRIELKKDAEITNRAGTRLKLGIERTVQLIEKGVTSMLLGIPIPAEVSMVCYRTTNVVTHRGDVPWTKDGGLVSIWLLGMFKHGPGVTVVVPIREGAGNAVNSDYFGEVAQDRLKTTDKAVFFKADGAYRSKIGVPPGRSTGLAGSYDPVRGTLTIVRTVPPADAASLPYVRSQWMDHADPYAGDLINAYNDGAPAPGEAPLGPFYELETSSPALPLQPGGKLTHIQETLHFHGDAKVLEPISKALLGVTPGEIAAAFPKS